MFQEVLWRRCEAPDGEAKSLGLVDLVEFQKFQEYGKSLDGRVAHVLPSGNMSFVEVKKSRGVWDFLKNVAPSTARLIGLGPRPTNMFWITAQPHKLVPRKNRKIKICLQNSR